MSKTQISKFSSVSQLCLTLCNPTDCRKPALPVHHQLSEFTQIHVYWSCDIIQLSHPLSSPTPPAFSLSQHQGLFKWVSSSHQLAKILEFQLQHQSFPWIFRTNSFGMDWLDLLSVQETQIWKGKFSFVWYCFESCKIYKINISPFPFFFAICVSKWK